MDVASIIGGTALRVLIVGSLPPAGRDYDVLVREEDRSTLADALRDQRFQPMQHRWVRFATGDPEVVELISATDWGLPDHETDALFTHAVPIDGPVQLYVPAPEHQLLILARKLPRTPGLLEPKHRRRVQEALVREPNAWALAQARAGDWGVEKRLRRLESRCARPPRAGGFRRAPRLPRRGAVIAFSGLDGVGKTTQAEALRATLTKLGYEATVVWTPLGSNPSLRRFASAGKRALARLPVGPLAHADRGTVERRLLSQTDDRRPAHSHGRKLAASTWSTIIALVNAASYRRCARGTLADGRIVIFDRYVLDTIVDLRFSYRPEGRLLVQEALVRLLAPTPRRTFLLDASPETAHSRKPDWNLAQTRVRANLYEREHRRHRVRRLDAERPTHELAAQIAHEVLETLAH